jgi:hypothetical protein
VEAPEGQRLEAPVDQKGDEQEDRIEIDLDIETESEKAGQESGEDGSGKKDQAAGKKSTYKEDGIKSNFNPDENSQEN